MVEKVVVRAPYRYEAAFRSQGCYLYFERGRCVLWSSTECRQSTTPGGMLLECGAYCVDFLDCGDEPAVVYAVHLYADTIAATPPLFTGTSALLPEAERSLLDGYFSALAQYFSHCDAPADSFVDIKVQELIALLAAAKGHDSHSMSRHLLRPRPTSLESVVEAHLYSPLGIEQMAHLALMSLSTFKRQFVQLYGMAPAAYFRLRRVEKAEQLLRNTTNTVGEIAFLTGFEDSSHFCKVFRRTVGTSPRQYRLGVRPGDTAE